jgi:hypothetical protein
MPHDRPQPVNELEAFCTTCSAAQDVTALLTQLGFRLEFQMEEQCDHTYQLPPLPAQYHYKDDAHGTEVVYLAGRDFPMNDDGCTLPPHASRFWLYAGADVQAFQSVASTLALAYQFTWCDPSAQTDRQEVA